ncbi:hypothetical protein MSSIT_0137 [Methanosarcina siciliae T4/M]|uniref:DUF8060 domain-containing protein n=2 Tax=Methanosarcina siciliae TaxID=38027 RepID=A0A0E3P9X0_9EURY|nr:hypothetical protein [Methanosarcina siciliae]AKB26856.1 hypothetical protein MSSIT_0137 [Methanosarcina siciliae T4/M]AKB30823.1 hypothetical protein MSSIH_0133 [Methanosarcina siciliae HI350]
MSETEELSPETKEAKTSDLRDNFNKGVFVIAMLLLLVATFQLYFSIERVIEIWFEYEYIPIFRAVYNFIVLLASLYVLRLYIVQR